MTQFNRDEAALRERRDRLVTLYETTGQVVAENEAAQTPEERQLASLRDELSSALLVLSPQNPRIRLLEAQVAQAEQRVASQAGTALADEADPQLSAYEIQLADIDGQIEAITAQKEQIAVTMENLQASIEATPGNAIRLEQLQRDYDGVRSQYDQAIANRARAETGDTIEAMAKGQRMTVIEQAVAPGSPNSPNRPMIAAAGIGAGFVLGLGIVVLIELMNSAVRRPADLISKLGITPYGTLPYIRTRGEAVRRRAIIATAFAVVLIAVPIGLLWIHTQITPIDLLIERALARLSLA